MPTPPTPTSHPAHYPQPTETAFAKTLKALEKSLPKHHAALVTLLEEGRFHDADAVVAVLEGDAS